ncbi:mitochondrial import inner membrane translocase subunit TIM17-3-like [Phragmites australis]|uniref:mitochondrial import inner membrane translocase subunit TIM17-3-like n=1 Tax=Phragmites australis TaxID=29695 RepID=UPI002D789FA9|nr:mitochondrial import inner membrane translocase subunit TIM17-3-like [Phragmites australis]
MATAPDFNREPCPDRILEDLGTSFGIGAVGGSAYHFVRGLYNSPNGHRLAGGATAIRMNAPRVGGSFAVWGGLFSVFDCGMVYARQKEDPWNSIAAAAAAGGVLSLRQGLLATGRAAAAGAAFLALIEGAGIMINRVVAAAPPPPEVMDMPQDPGQHAPAGGFPPAPPIGVQELPVPAESGPTGWFSGLFGRKQDSNVAAKSGVLEIDLPSTAVPSFDYK